MVVIDRIKIDNNPSFRLPAIFDLSVVVEDIDGISVVDVPVPDVVIIPGIVSLM